MLAQGALLIFCSDCFRALVSNRCAAQKARHFPPVKASPIVKHFPRGRNAHVMSISMYGTAPKLGSTEIVDWTRSLAPLGPGRLKVIIDVSNKCNLRCQMCHFSFDDVFHQPAH